MQRLYALAIYLLREFIRAISFDRFFEYKARVILSCAETSLVVAAALAISMATGHPMALLRSTGLFVGSWGVVGLVFYYANGVAERRLLPRFEMEFARLKAASRITGTVFLLLLIALTVAAAIEAAFDARGL
jgi:hypothetical protein